MLLHLVDASGEHAGRAYRIVRQELDAYGGGLSDKHEIVALSKVDIVDEATLKTQTERLRRAIAAYGPAPAPGEKRARPHMLSAATGKNVTAVLRALLATIDERRREETARTQKQEWRP